MLSVLKGGFHVKTQIFVIISYRLAIFQDLVIKGFKKCLSCYEKLPLKTFVTNSVIIPRILSFFGYFMHVTFNCFRQVKITFFIFEGCIYRERVTTELFPQMFFTTYNLLIALGLTVSS